MFKDAMITSGILKEDGDKFKVKFAYDKDKIDIMINDSISLSELFVGSPTKAFSNEDIYAKAKENLDTLISDMMAYYVSQGNLNNSISNMTNVLVDKISNTQAYFKVGDTRCIKISIKDQDTFEVSKYNEDDKVCQKFYTTSGVKELLGEHPRKNSNYLYW